MNGWRFRGLAAAAAIVLGMAAAGCGGTDEPTPAHGTAHKLAVDVTTSFPAEQKLAEQSRLLVTIKNVSNAAMPNVAVTLTNPEYGTAAQALGTLIAPTRQGQPIIANRSRPIWIINQGPGPCGYSCRNLGPGAGATAYSNTWALGTLKPGHTVTFAWHVTAVQAGDYAVRYVIAPALDGSAVATDPSGRPAAGTLKVRIASSPRRALVKSDGQVVYSG